MIFKVEETPSAEVPTQPPVTMPKPKSPWPRRVAMVVIVSVVILGAFFAYWWFSRPPQIPWLFSGAYGKYEASTIVDSTTINATMRIEFVESNATHGELLMYMKMTSPSFTEPYEYQETTWFNLRGESYDIPNATLLSNTEDYMYFEGFGTRYCTTVKYAASESGVVLNMTMYADKETDWPLRIRYDYTQPFSLSLDLKLVETNISELNE